ncbi:hypothetical protein B0H10DRAFT_1953737 [Mycena sp. CBHHK59/15]|nr:hypothetical protein B0H10DRAFT_1953737 [Mycena sp. CBHHK59/15]
MVSKKVVPQTDPAEIKVDGGKKLRTTINEETKKHHVICDLCGADFTLTMATNSRCFFDHRGSAGCTNWGATQEQRRQKAAALAMATGSISGLGQAVLSAVCRPHAPSGYSTPSGSTTPTLLIKYFGPGAQVDFIQIFSDKGCDFLRPLGTYVGVRKTEDDKWSEAEDGHPLPPISDECNTSRLLAVPTPRHTEEHDVIISSASFALGSIAPVWSF